MADYIAIATWPFGRIAVEAAAALLKEGRPALDAAVAGGQAVEDDPKVNSVGYAGVANRIGNVSLDASVMDGRTMSCGGVAGVENIKHVAALARRVMEMTSHLLLVGTGAQQFALQQGFPLENLHTPDSITRWERTRKRAAEGAILSDPDAGGAADHDTVAVLARDTASHFGGCCTTSGLAQKLPGRVGDSPLIGHGLYVDDEAGAAGATGVGEEVSRIAGSFFVIESMRAGLSAQAACEAAVRRVNALAARRGVRPAHLAFVALDVKGNPGACCTAGTGFQYAVARPGQVEVFTAKEIGPEGP